MTKPTQKKVKPVYGWAIINENMHYVNWPGEFLIFKKRTYALKEKNKYQILYSGNKVIKVKIIPVK